MNQSHPANQYECATCKRAVALDGPLPPLYPFCCERCRMVDLGRWFTEAYTIGRDLSPEEIADSIGPARE